MFHKKPAFSVTNLVIEHSLDVSGSSHKVHSQNFYVADIKIAAERSHTNEVVYNLTPNLSAHLITRIK